MKERPILFSGPMVKAILDGRKTQTRRVVKRQPAVQNGQVLIQGIGERPVSELAQFCPYGRSGDRLWVRETWGIGQQCKDGPDIWYKATEDRCAPRWKPSIHMTRAYSRITLEICEVRAEQLQDISEEDATAEGIERTSIGFRDYDLPANVMHGVPAIYSFQSLWDSINKARGYGWDTNPWVWAITFRRLTP